jgi:hypothetical protein
LFLQDPTINAKPKRSAIQQANAFPESFHKQPKTYQKKFYPAKNFLASDPVFVKKLPIGVIGPLLRSQYHTDQRRR